MPPTADGTNISYIYDDSGIRTQKTVNGVATEYFLDGSAIIAEKTGNDVKWYYYDGDGTREAIEYKGNVYYYFYNAQGDVMGLYDNNLNVVVNYTCDSWGNVVSITGSLAKTLGQDNPFRYRGYYFDSDTGLYYLNSRYYDANTGRFINADGYVQTGQGLLDKTMFAYCMNNPILYQYRRFGNMKLGKSNIVLSIVISLLLIIISAIVYKDFSYRYGDKNKGSLTVNENASDKPNNTDANSKLQNYTVAVDLDKEYSRKLSNAKSNTEITEINSEFADKWKNEIDTNYQKLLTISEKSFREKLIISQAEWYIYAKKYIDERYEYLLEEYQTGTTVPIIISEFECNLYRERAIELFEMYNKLNELHSSVID